MKKNCEGQFKVAQYTSNQIVFINTKTKILYEYYQMTQTYQPAMYHDQLVLPIVFQNILLYPKMKSNLSIELKNRRNAYNKTLYSQEELVYTFLPILNCLRDLHSNKIIYKKLDKESILVNDEGQIKLQDWNILKADSKYYSPKQSDQMTQQDDLRALGLIILESAILQSQQNIINCSGQPVLSKIVEFYSKNFILAIIVMIFKLQKHYDEIKNLLTDQKYLLKQQKSQIQLIYQRLLENPQKQQVKSKLQVENDKRVLLKKNNIDLSKLQKKEIGMSESDKEMFLMRKNQIEKVHKIIERSSVFVNQLISKRAEELKKNACFLPINITNRGLENSEIRKISTNSEYSPFKKIRMISRKR